MIWIKFWWPSSVCPSFICIEMSFVQLKEFPFFKVKVINYFLDYTGCSNVYDGCWGSSWTMWNQLGRIEKAGIFSWRGKAAFFLHIKCTSRNSLILLKSMHAWKDKLIKSHKRLQIVINHVYMEGWWINVYGWMGEWIFVCTRNVMCVSGWNVCMVLYMLAGQYYVMLAAIFLWKIYPAVLSSVNFTVTSVTA